MKSILFPFYVLCLLFFFQETSTQTVCNRNLGYGFSPKGHPFDYSQMATFLHEVSGTCGQGVVLANGNWRDSYFSSGVIPKFQKDICNLQPFPFNYIDMVVFSWGTPTKPYTLYLDVPENNTNNWTNTYSKSKFLKMLIHAADSLKPAYFFIGNEISFYWEQDSVDYLNWLNFYHQAYDSIKVYSPLSKVGVVFNYEHVSGKGKLVGWNKSFWNAFSTLDTSRIDILGVTVYPFFNYKTANEIPLDYLNQIFDKLGKKPLAITETGWPADSLLANWECSPQQQVDFINKLFSITKDRNVEVINWLYLYYLMDKTSDSNKISASIAMHDSLGNERPGLSIWLSNCKNTCIFPKINHTEAKTLVIYPNPFSVFATIESNLTLNNAKLKIFDLNGKVVTQGKDINGNLIQIKRDNLLPGIYLFQISDNDQIFYGKFIVE